MNSPEKMTLQATVELDGSGKMSAMDESSWSGFFSWIARIFILLALIAAPWMIGSVAPWAQFWIASALMVALAFWWFATALNSRQAQTLPYLAVFLVFGILIGLFQVLPISGSLGDFFLGRQIELYQQFGQPPPSSSEAFSTTVRPRISLNTVGTWHDIRLLVIALSAMLLSCRYFRTPRDLTIFFAAMTLNGVAISLFGLIQKLTWNHKLFWSIELQYGGSPFGPFVNRNNAGGYLLICLACAIGLMYLMMSFRRHRGPVPIISREIPVWRQFSHQLLYFISELTALKLASLIGIIFIAAGVIATISRGSILALLVGTVVTIVCYGIAKRPKNLSVIILPLGMAVAMLTVWLGFNQDIMKRFESIKTSGDVSEWNVRVQTWKDTWPSVAEMGKLGSGLGTYETVSRLYRTDHETSIFKFAENQYYQALIESGWPGLILYFLAWGVAVHYSWFLLRVGQSPATVSAGVAGIFLLSAQAVASFLDFGFYIPANTLAMACTMGVIGCYAHSMAYRLKKRSWLRFPLPNSMVQVLLVAVFAATTMTSLDLNRKSSIDRLRATRRLTRENSDLKSTTERIKQLSVLANKSRSVMACNELGRLWIHLAQLELFDHYRQQHRVDPSEQELLDQLWNRTQLLNIQGHSELLRGQSKLSQNEFRSLAPIQSNLPIAKIWLDASLRLAPMQPEEQVTLGQIVAVLEDVDAAGGYLERGVELAPANGILLRQVAVVYLQANEFERAAPHLKRYLELEPGNFRLMMSVVDQQLERSGQAVGYDLVLDQMIPDDPQLLFQFAADYAPEGSDTKILALERAEAALEQVSQSELFVNVLKGRIKLAQGDLDAGIKYFEAASINDPNDNQIRMELITVLEREHRYSEALEQAEALTRGNNKSATWRRIRDRIESKLNAQRKVEQ